eukprot:CAMPEP_0118650836 /NCGR_PEP_ID=MMETSP0785-20121206/10458_1 /TAXON_ID=91992 /ORGANISM="Bolidomonas pacifica, Strain CCMP 1866" /LENGTH=363 /DNA_ID=CAMNT_0006543235 /DNA_START=323 /DNA_END=1410 /DNA_ORIENTATION=-
MEAPKSPEAVAVSFHQKFRTASDQVADHSGCVCWSSVRGQPCGGDCGLCHFPADTCGSHLNFLLGGRRRGCGFGDRCKKVHLEQGNVLAAIEPFSRSAAAPTLSSSAVASRTISRTKNSTSGSKKCTVPPHVVVARIKKHSDKSPYIDRFLNSPFLNDFLDDNDLRLLLASTKNRAKEICEAYAAADRVLEIFKDAPSLTIFDICSGKGFLAVFLSFLLPDCKIIMLDADGNMKVPHVNSRPNLSFHQCDIFQKDCARLIERETGEGGKCILVGIHLCGNLTPRLIDLGCSLDCCSGFVVCPCCLKGKLGSDCNCAGKALGGGQNNNYNVLIDTMRAEAVSRGGGTVKVEFDDKMISPKNGFV